MSMNLAVLLYLIASVCFIQALKGLSHPTTSIRGNVFGMSGMAIAILTTAALIVELAGGKAQGMVYVLGGLLVDNAGVTSAFVYCAAGTLAAALMVLVVAPRREATA